MFIKGVQSASRQHQFIPLIFGANHDEELEGYYLQELIKRAVDGLIIASASITGETIDNILKKNGIPYLLIDQNGGPSLDRIRIEMTGAADLPRSTCWRLAINGWPS
jgi:Transcriptional regulators